eukprot:255440-Amphidinium_carterae.1
MTTGTVVFHKGNRGFLPAFSVNGKQTFLRYAYPKDETPEEMEKGRVRAQALLKNTREELAKCRDGSKEEFEKAKQ